MKKYDAIIIGFGKAGKTLAFWLANKGKKVALIEKDSKMYGGTCINIGCIPTKILVEESEREIKDYSKAIEHKNNLIAKLRASNYNKLDKLDNIDIYNGLGSFVSQHTISVKHEGEETILESELIFINTGAKEIIPHIEGVDSVKNIYTSSSIMEIDKLPKKLAIIGGGYIGLEFASIYSNFGSKVTILEGTNDILKREEPEVVNEIKQDFAQRSIDILTTSQVTSLRNVDNDAVEVSYIKDGVSNTLVVDALLIAIGRKANIDELNLDKANVVYNERGINVNEFLQTNIEHIYALGDVKGQEQFTYISLDDYRIVKNYLFEDKSLTTKTRHAIPISLFISPTLSRVGLTEQEALDKGYQVKTKVMKVNVIPRAKILKSEQGIYKVIVDKETNQILGASLYGIESSEIINIIAIAIKEDKPFTYLRDFIFTHPTMAESLNDLFDL